MPRRDLFHNSVCNGLTKEGWVITHDPYLLRFGEQTLQVDIGAEAPIAAEQNGRKIAVEIKSFTGDLTMHDLYAAIGQYALYMTALKQKEAERTLWLAIPRETFDMIFDLPHGRRGRED